MSKLTSTLDLLAKTSAILAVVGYITLRAHFNYLGVSAMTTLGFERYLTEAYVFVLATLWRLIIIGGAWCAVFLVVKLLAPATVYYWVAGHYAASMQTVLAHRSVVMGILLSLLAIGTLSAVLSLGSQRDVIVGILENVKINSGKAWRYEACLNLFLGALFVCNSGLTNPGSAEPLGSDYRAPLAHRAAILTVALIGLSLPMVFGQAAHPTDFPLAEVFLSDPRQPQACGLMIYETEKEIALWHASKGVGSIVVIPRDRVNRIEVGPLKDAITLARVATAFRAADNSASVPSCQP